MFFRKRPIPIPDPGQQVRLSTRRGAWRGKWRAISVPSTNARGEAVIWIAPEWEYQDALREGHRAVGMPWPVKHMVVVLPSEVPEDYVRPTGSSDKGGTSTDAFGSDAEEPRRWWWLRYFGF